MPEPKRPIKVFLSYASQDKPLVRELSRRLVGEGWIDPWQDEKKLLPGQDWRVKIEEAVEEADVVIIVLSQNSVSKEGHVQKELRYAREIALEKPEDTIFLIPLRLEECEVPRGLRFYQWVDYFGERKNDGYASLVESLQLRYEQKLKQEEEASARQEKIRKEREAAEKIVRENAEKEAVEKARLESMALAKQKAAKERAEREAARKQVEKEAAEKVRLEEEEQARQKAAKEKVEREAAEKATREKAEKEAAEKARLASEEIARRKIAKEKADRESTKKARLETEEQAMLKSAKEKRQVEEKFAHGKAEREKKKTKSIPVINIVVIALIGFVGVVCIIIIGNFSRLFNAIPIPTATIISIVENIPTKVFTSTSVSPTLTIAATETSTLVRPTLTIIPTETLTPPPIPPAQIVTPALTLSTLILSTLPADTSCYQIVEYGWYGGTNHSLATPQSGFDVCYALRRYPSCPNIQIDDRYCQCQETYGINYYFPGGVCGEINYPNPPAPLVLVKP
jgi:hypothetical protein